MRPILFVFSSLLLAAALTMSTPNPSSAQWSADPTVNNLVFAGSTAQYGPTLVSDGAGGAILGWYDVRGGVGSSILYGERLSVFAARKWDWSGLLIGQTLDGSFGPTMIADGRGGAIFYVNQSRTGPANICAQRADSTGTLTWGANPVMVCGSPAGYQSSAAISSDGAGGAIFSWVDGRAGNNDKYVYAQRIDASGATRWTTNGVPICTVAGDTYVGSLSSMTDGAGGAIIAWQDSRSGTSSDVMAQRVDSTGTVLWASGGIAIAATAAAELNPVMVSDGADGAIIAWLDTRRNGVQWDLYAQRVSAMGTLQWAGRGVPFSSSTLSKAPLVIASDDAGGVIGAWVEGANYVMKLYAGRITSAGSVAWTASGVPIDTLPGNPQQPAIVKDGSHGAVIAWQTQRGGTKTDIYAQRINPSGNVQWTGNGAGIATGPLGKSWPALLGDGSGGAIVSWLRSGPLYASHVNGLGALGPITTGVDDGDGAPPASYSLSGNYPNPFTPTTVIRFTVPGARHGTAAGGDPAPVVTLRVYDTLGREVATLVDGVMSPGAHTMTWTARNLPGGVYFSRLTAGSYSETRKLMLLK